jgi:hypothetical protein
MKYRLLVALTVLNLVLLFILLAQMRQASAAQEVAPVLRGRALQILDDQGKVRASISVMPASTQKDGSVYPETVLLRLITEKGRPSVKISASEETTGAAFVGPTGTKNTYTQPFAKGTTSVLTLKDEDGREQVIKPY